MHEIPVAGLTPEGVAGSLKGADVISPHVEALREQVYAVIVAAGEAGVTDKEIQQALGIKGNTERPRRWELWTAGRIRLRRNENGDVLYRRAGVRVRALIWVAGEEQRCSVCATVYTKTRFLEPEACEL